MDPMAAELRQLAQMSMVSERKKSFGAVTIEAQIESSSAIARQTERGKSTKTNLLSNAVTAEATAATSCQPEIAEASHRPIIVEPINCESTNEIGDSDEDIFIDSSDDQLSSSPSPRRVISPELSRVDAADDFSYSTFPRKYRKASVRFSEDTMVRQRENESRLAAAASSDWAALDDVSYVDGGVDDDGAETSEKSDAAVAEDDISIPDWRKDNPVPSLGDDTMNWHEREDKLQNALDWLRREIKDMKKQDQLLMCQFIQLRSDIHQLKCSGTKRKSRKMAGSCNDVIKSTPYRPDPGTALTKFQSTMELNNKNNDKFDEDDEDEDDFDICYDGDDPERTLIEPEYLPEYRPRTMSLLPPIQKRRLLGRMRTSRNKSFSAGSAENTDRGLSDLIE